MEKVTNRQECTIYGHVREKATRSVIRNAEVVLEAKERDSEKWAQIQDLATVTDAEGRYEFRFIPEKNFNYRVECRAFGKNVFSEEVEAQEGEAYRRNTHLELGLKFTVKSYAEDGKLSECQEGKVGRRYQLVLESPDEVKKQITDLRWGASPEASLVSRKELRAADFVPQQSGEHTLTTSVIDGKGAIISLKAGLFVGEADRQMVGGQMTVRLERTATPPTLDQAFWSAIRNRTEAISFGRYREFIDKVMEGGYDFHAAFGNKVLDEKLKDVKKFRHGVQAYELLKVATQVFLLVNCGVKVGDAGKHADVSFDSLSSRLEGYLGHSPQLPYIKRVIQTAFPWLERDGVGCDCVLTAAHEPCLIELIREYFLEEGMLMQTMNAVTLRFQNVHAPGDRDPLASFEIDPLRPLGNILWGRTQDFHLLSVKRRAYEYMHQYGLALYGKATTSLRPADNRSKFLEAFHNLLYLCSVFFKEDNDTTVIADGYPLLNALREVHLVLAQGAHNQFGDLPWTARAETLVQQWVIAQPEIREFLQSRAMVPYTEPWMPQVDTMKTLQGWSDVTVSHFRDLGVYGERIILSIRFGDWIADLSEDHAKHWARFFRADIQAYLHAYRAVTGVDLTNPDTVDATLPGVHLQKRLALQHGSR